MFTKGPFSVVPEPKPESSRRKATRGKSRASAMERSLTDTYHKAGDHTAKKVLASGAYKGIGEDGDVQACCFIVEAKNYTPVQGKGGKQLTFEIDWLNKVMEEAKLHNKPGIVVYQAKGSHRKYVVADHDQFVALYEVFNRRNSAHEGDTCARCEKRTSKSG